MRSGSEGFESGIALALSGGGFRATLFHIGSCRRLLELGVLTGLARISSVSGGSIFSGVLASTWGDLVRDPTVANYDRQVTQLLRQFCRQQVDTTPAVRKHVSHIIATPLRPQWPFPAHPLS